MDKQIKLEIEELEERIAPRGLGSASIARGAAVPDAAAGPGLTTAAGAADRPIPPVAAG